MLETQPSRRQIEIIVTLYDSALFIEIFGSCSSLNSAYFDIDLTLLVWL
jgi:hypothetical protein